MSMINVSVGDRVQTIKGRGVVVADCDTNVVIELDGDHGTYFFGKEHIWDIVEDNQDE